MSGPRYSPPVLSMLTTAERRRLAVFVETHPDFQPAALAQAEQDPRAPAALVLLMRQLIHGHRAPTIATDTLAELRR